MVSSTAFFIIFLRKLTKSPIGFIDGKLTKSPIGFIDGIYMYPTGYIGLSTTLASKTPVRLDVDPAWPAGGSFPDKILLLLCNNSMNHCLSGCVLPIAIVKGKKKEYAE